MFEAAEVGQKVSKQAFKEEVPVLRTELLNAQRALLTTDASLVIIVSGVEGAGKSEVVNRLTEWLDPRSVRTFAFWEETDEERSRPRDWRFWRALPPKGRIHILFGSWYTQPIIRRVFGQIDNETFEKQLRDIEAFERMLVDSGTRFLKLWFHLPKSEQRARVTQKAERKLKNIAKAKALAEKGGKKGKKKKKKGTKGSKEHSVTETPSRKLATMEADFSKRYDDFTPVCARAIQLTDTGVAPWQIVEASNRRFRDLSAGRLVRSALQQCLEQRETGGGGGAGGSSAWQARVSDQTVLDSVDLSPELDDAVYRERLKSLQRNLYDLAWAAYNARRSLVAVFEGWDAAGKGGAIRRFTGTLDARLFRVISIAAPTDEEKAQHYLWRFWRHIPTGGHVTVYDRSWYGRVLVERVERFCSVIEWERAFSEINAFEERLTEHGIGIAKFWIHLGKDEQLRRFEERERIPWKKHKITDEDWRNREKWDDYACAIDDMVARTSTPFAPWHLVPGNDKKFARVRILELLKETFERMLAR